MIQGIDSPEQPGLENKKKQQKFTLLPLSSPGSWAGCLGLAGAGQIAAFGIQILNIFFFQSKAVLGMNPRSLGDEKHVGRVKSNHKDTVFSQIHSTYGPGKGKSPCETR